MSETIQDNWMQDYWNEARSLQGSASRQKLILQAIIDGYLIYDDVRSWAERSAALGEVSKVDIINNNPLSRYMQEVTGEDSWWIEQAGFNDPHMVIGVADTGVVHLSNDPNQGELPPWAQKCMAALIRLPYPQWMDRSKFLALLSEIDPQKESQ